MFHIVSFQICNYCDSTSIVADTFGQVGVLWNKIIKGSIKIGARKYPKMTFWTILIVAIALYNWVAKIIFKLRIVAALQRHDGFLAAVAGLW